MLDWSILNSMLYVVPFLKNTLSDGKDLRIRTLQFEMSKYVVLFLSSSLKFIYLQL